jgi:hypothetical protein
VGPDIKGFKVLSPLLPKIRRNFSAIHAQLKLYSPTGLMRALPQAADFANMRQAPERGAMTFMPNRASRGS